MSKSMLAVGLAVLVLGVAGCGDSFEKIAEDQVSLDREYVGVLKGITDEASAKAAVPKIEALAVRGEAIKKRFNDLGEPTQEDVERALKKAFTSTEQAPDSTSELIRLQGNREVITIIKPAVTKYQASEF